MSSSPTLASPPRDAAGWAALARTWCDEHPPPVGAPMGSRTPRDAAEHDEWLSWSRAFHASGLATVAWPTDIGGGGADPATSYAVAEVLSAAGMPNPLTDIGVAIVAPAVRAFGTPEQRRAHLDAIRAGDTIWTQLFSEPEAGSDLASVRTTATRHDSAWVINGQKVWNTYAHIADQGFLIARTGSRDDRHRGLTVFLVPMSNPGVTVRPIQELTGDSDFCEVFLDDVRLDDRCVLGEVNGGWAVCMDLLVHERHHAADQTARVLAELDRMVALLGEQAPTHPVRDELANICARALALRGLLRSPGGHGLELVQKIVFSDLNLAAHRLMLDVLADPAVEVPPAWRARWTDNYLYSWAYTISGGANEVLRNVLAKRHLGLA